MPKNKGKGGKNRRRGKNDAEQTKRELILCEEGQIYAQVVKMLGNARVDTQCFDGIRRLCHIRGTMRKKVWINTGDIVLVSLRDYQEAKGDVICKYLPEEARQLKLMGHLPSNARINEIDFGGSDSDQDDSIEFQDDGGIDIEAL